MLWTANLICLVNLVQASLPSLSEIVSRTRLCLGENAHCPVNIFKNLDLCCKPLVCTVVPKTCKPNFINKYFNISDYKDRRCMFPSKSLSSSESSSQSLTPGPLNSTSMTNEFAITTYNELTSDYSNGTDYSKETNMTEIDNSGDSTYNKTMDTLSNQSGSNNETDYESDEENIDAPSEKSFHGSLLDSESYYIDSNNETRRLVKRYVSNSSSSESTLSISSVSLEGGPNNTFEQESQFSKTSNESGNSFVSSQPQTNASQEYSDSGSVAESGEIYDYENNETKIEEPSTHNFASDLKHRPSEKIYSTTPRALAEPEEDWHSSDMKSDSRPKVFKIVTIPPPRWFQTGAQVVKLNLSSEISE